MADILQTTFSKAGFFNENYYVLISISLKFVPIDPIYNMTRLVQIILDANQATIHHLNQWWHNLLTHMRHLAYMCPITFCSSVTARADDRDCILLWHNGLHVPCSRTSASGKSVGGEMGEGREKDWDRDHIVYAPSQWETMLHSNVASHWLSAYTKWSMYAPSQWETTLYSNVVSHWLSAYTKWSMWERKGREGKGEYN